MWEPVTARSSVHASVLEPRRGCQWETRLFFVFLISTRCIFTISIRNLWTFLMRRLLSRFITEMLMKSVRTWMSQFQLWLAKNTWFNYIVGNKKSVDLVLTPFCPQPNRRVLSDGSWTFERLIADSPTTWTALSNKFFSLELSNDQKKDWF